MNCPTFMCAYFIFCAVLSSGGVAHATNSEQRAAISERHASEMPRSSAVYPSSGVGAASLLQVSVGQQDKRAVIAVADILQNGIQWQLKLSSPWDSNSSTTELATLDGLARGFKVEFGLNHLFFSPSYDVDSMTTVCRQARTLAGKPDAECNDDLYGLVDDRDFNRQVLKAYFGGKSFIPSVYASIAASSDDFEFFGHGFEREKDSKTSLGASVGLALLNPVKSSAFLVDYQRQRAYADDRGSQATVCVPLNEVPAVSCTTSFLRPPVAKDKNIFSIEYRKQWGNSRAAVARIAYEQKEDVLGISVPIYLLSNQGKGLSGGIQFGWNDRERDFTAAIFVSAPFSLFYK